MEEHRCFDGVQRIYRHDSQTIGLPMRFSVFLPKEASSRKVPALFYLAGLTCTEETFPIKAGAQRYAAEHGIALIAPDTSPRGADIPGEKDAWDFGVGAGFYVDATREPWAPRYRMYSYVTQELRKTVIAELTVREDRIGIFGHSMGGHGALVLALRNPDLYRSVSAFAPIAAPSQCPWGVKAFSGYLGDDREAWKQYDASELIKGDAAARFEGGILIDQGLADQFLAEQLYPEVFERNARDARHKVTVRRHERYDHGYFFISTFVGEHIAHHACTLCR
ncbi:S-formylglutathione hydrolase [Candidatus Paraburkholderia kirkii UZHbot1]|uniref:S-formylglutathione hydrolase n=1 Tax=Candidatus Paraburkholderia kirkii UZHbot1 TaxID=1055526 RepID=G4M733_9BURK|nr:S-formylglutathione hydrolase [Candidatus Paraburkholderia kirkii UZHbot1]